MCEEKLILLSIVGVTIFYCWEYCLYFFCINNFLPFIDRSESIMIFYANKVTETSINL